MQNPDSSEATGRSATDCNGSKAPLPAYTLRILTFIPEFWKTPTGSQNLGVEDQKRTARRNENSQTLCTPLPQHPALTLWPPSDKAGGAEARIYAASLSSQLRFPVSR